jgi:hypothetical protein
LPESRRIEEIARIAEIDIELEKGRPAAKIFVRNKGAADIPAGAALADPVAEHMVTRVPPL